MYTSLIFIYLFFLFSDVFNQLDLYRLFQICSLTWLDRPPRIQ